MKNNRIFKKIYDSFRTASIRLGVETKIRDHWYPLIKKMKINITDQYSSFKLDSDYLKFNVRMMHAFQMSLFEKAYRKSGFESDTYIGFESDTYIMKQYFLIDFGDSAGTHSLYIKELWPDIKTISVNIDDIAIKKIREKGLEAYHINNTKDIRELCNRVDYIVAFQVLEHLEEPITVLKELGNLTSKLILTVPYLRKSRVLPYYKGKKNPESTHIFELSPKDWKALFSYAGWKIEEEEIMYQYPKYIPLLSWLLKKYWQRYDFEGFYGVILRKEVNGKNNK